MTAHPLLYLTVLILLVSLSMIRLERLIGSALPGIDSRRPGRFRPPFEKLGR